MTSLAEMIIEAIDGLTDDELAEVIAEVSLDLIVSAGEGSCVAEIR